MIRSIVMHDISINDIAAMERYYFEHHAAELVRRYGPWLARFESFMPVPAPADAQAYGFYNYRVTDGWWRELPERGPKGTFAFTMMPAAHKVAYCFIPAQLTEDFKGYELQPHEKNVLRWFILFKYPEGVSQQEGEDWFLNVHAKEAMNQPGLFRFFSYRAIKEPTPLPGTWTPGPRVSHVIGGGKWDRVCELWYETFDDWRESVIVSPPDYTPPAWAKYKTYPFLEPSVDFISTFLLERPADEFLRDSRGYH
jgi:hypothetical protein